MNSKLFLDRLGIVLFLFFAGLFGLRQSMASRAVELVAGHEQRNLVDPPFVQEPQPEVTQRIECILG